MPSSASKSSSVDGTAKYTVPKPLPNPNTPSAHSPTARPTRPALPINWPSSSGITYLTQPTSSPHVTRSLLKLLNTPSRATAALPKTADAELAKPCPLVRIERITDAAHPAYGQCGLFATRHLPPGSFVLHYLGRVHTDAVGDTDPESDYDLSLERDVGGSGTGLSVDATGEGNEARFVNDYRGIRDRPNAEFRDCWVRVGEGGWERRIGVFVMGEGKSGKWKAGVAKGEEICVSYGKGFWRGRSHADEVGGGGDEADGVGGSSGESGTARVD